jgi:ADP-ribose pyrophosphatase
MTNLLGTDYSVKTADDMSVTIEKSDVVYDGFFKMFRYHLKHSLFNGGMSSIFTREVMSRPNAVAVLLVDPVLKEVVLIKQFRAGALENNNPWLEELVAGLIDPGELPEDVARRETKEETGLALLGELTKIAEYYGSAGGSNEMTTLYYGEVDASQASGVHGLEGENEDILVIRKSFKDFFSSIDQCQADTASLVIGAMWLKNKIMNPTG